MPLKLIFFTEVLSRARVKPIVRIKNIIFLSKFGLKTGIKIKPGWSLLIISERHGLRKINLLLQLIAINLIFFSQRTIN